MYVQDYRKCTLFKCSIIFCCFSAALQIKLCTCFEITRRTGKLEYQLLNSIHSFLMHSLFVCIQIAHWRGLIAAFSVIRYDATLQKFLFCVFVELVISKMPFRSECFVTQWARNIFFNVNIPVMLSESFLGLELFATHIANHNCQFWFLQFLWSYSGQCLS